MSIYRILVEWAGEGKRNEGLIFFEAETSEQAKADTQKIVDRVLHAQQQVRITSEAKDIDPEFLVMWDKTEIDRLILPNAAKLKPVVLTQPQPQPPVQPMSIGSSPSRIPPGLKRQLRGGRR
jgi:hypothetical protein